jgi:glycosyltransferase involved in cell wall biosynthesis
VEKSASVSVIIPTYRRPDVLPRAITSAQQQTLKPAQILVVDDGSGDDTPSVVRKFSSVTLLQQKNTGPARARNLGLQSAQGEYVVSLDHDDEWDETFLESAVTALEAHHADVAWVNFRQTGPYSFQDYLQADKRPRHLFRDNQGDVLIMEQDAALNFFLFSNGAASNSALVFRREALGAGWDPSTQVADDLLVMARLLFEKKWRCLLLLQPLWTKHEDTASYSRHSEATLRRCLVDFEKVAKLAEGHFTTGEHKRWQKNLGNLRYKLAYQCLWNSGRRVALAEFKEAMKVTGLTTCAVKLMFTAVLRKLARTIGIPPMSTWHRNQPVVHKSS